MAYDWLMENRRVAVTLLIAMIFCPGTVYSQDYPTKSIRIHTSGAGGSGDIVARLIAQGISGPLGQPVIVENRGSVISSVEAVAKAAPDGYTLLVTGTVMWLGPLLHKTSYDPIKDFLPITLGVFTPNTLVVHPSLPVRSVNELIALAKARPGELNYASTQPGGSIHLAAELFKFMAGVSIEQISYSSTPAALTDLISGRVQMMFIPGVGPYIKSGKLRALAVTSKQPSELMPGLPAVADWLPGYESTAMNGMFAPAKTPATIINRLNQEVVRVLSRADVKEKCLTFGVETVGSTPEQFAGTIKSDMANISKMIKAAGIRAE